MRKAFFVLLGVLGLAVSQAADEGWKKLPLVKDGKLSKDWVHIGFGGWTVEGDTIMTDPAPEGLGLLVYEKEKLGNCQIKVVFKLKDARANSGVYVRIDDGILKQVNNPGEKFTRDEKGNPTKESEEKVKVAAEKGAGPWYAVHHGYEVQIAGNSTGSIYSLANTAVKAEKFGEWRTMIITLAGDKIAVELDGEKASSFDTSTKDLPERKIWHQPQRENKRPQKGYIGLQTHDPGDTVWFKEISVRPLSKR
jgi:hypothetical protein